MLLQGGLTVGHRAHNPKIGGSIPLPARKNLSKRITMFTLIDFIRKEFSRFKIIERNCKSFWKIFNFTISNIYGKNEIVPI